MTKHNEHEVYRIDSLNAAYFYSVYADGWQRIDRKKMEPRMRNRTAVHVEFDSVVPVEERQRVLAAIEATFKAETETTKQEAEAALKATEKG